ncbi:unnamed protein product [Paramecium octaurelia]|uniref:Uncharacterized protein n=1 Tax=Paramecium octaurelia TaxID=43137 RepID=A0A8S1YNB5_PAROT|nr:unnamed protein product [Paramecium octaurelia]
MTIALYANCNLKIRNIIQCFIDFLYKYQQTYQCDALKNTDKLINRHFLNCGVKLLIHFSQILLILE